MVDTLGDVGASLNGANPDRMRKVYVSLRLEMIYNHSGRAVDVIVKPLGGLWVCPRGRHATLAARHAEAFHRYSDTPRRGLQGGLLPVRRAR